VDVGIEPVTFDRKGNYGSWGSAPSAPDFPNRLSGGALGGRGSCYVDPLTGSQGGVGSRARVGMHCADVITEPKSGS
jgi:hypothetical protein